MEIKLMSSVLRVVLVDINPRVVDAWKWTFQDTPEVEIVLGSILDQDVDAWVSPTNSAGRMDGGVDAVVKRRFGPDIQTSVRREIHGLYEGMMPIGSATCVPTGINAPRFLISTPTMVRSAEDVSQTLNVALACAAAFQALHMQNAREPGSILSVALPGLGAATGRVPPRTCANLMWTGYALFRDCEFRDFATMRAALLEQLREPELSREDTRIRVPVPSFDDDFIQPAAWLRG